jgi:hypothetical protein
LNSQSLKTRAWLICGSKAAVSAVLLFSCLVLPAAGGQCKETVEIISNNTKYLAGSGDTLWMASYGQQGWGVNYTVNHGAAWWGYYLGCFGDDGVTSIAFGNGRFAAVLNPPDAASDRTKPTSVWHFTHANPANSRVGTFTVAWPASILADTTVVVRARSAVFVAGKFYLAGMHGGLLCWDPITDSLHGFLPGDTGSFVPAAFSRVAHPRFGSDSTAVLAVERFGDSGVLAVTGPRLWVFDAVGHTWSGGILSRLADTAFHFGGYVSAVVNNTVRPPLVYAYVDYRAAGIDQFSLFRYHTPVGQWSMAFSHYPAVAAPAVRGGLYAVQGDNQIAAWRDTVPDSVAASVDSLKLVITEQQFDARLLRGSGVVKPAAINDVLFMKKTDSTGTLCIASSDGLFISWNEQVGDTGSFGVPVKRFREIKGGLEETYALPGILTNDPRWPQAARTTFVYKLGGIAKVTIRIYDYNMQFVKTVTDNKERPAATPLGRSTDGKNDVWDGTNAFGRPVAPGVYYYKITTNKGERSFGKIVVAKGAGN